MNDTPSPANATPDDFGALVLRLQAHYLRAAEPGQVFDALLPELLAHTRSEYGFISEVWYDEARRPYLKMFTLTDIAWNEHTRALYATRAQGIEFRNLESLLGAALKTGEPVISNAPQSDPRSAGLPRGHPGMRAYMGVPLHHGGVLVGLVGLANRPEGYDTALIEALQPLWATVGAIIGQVQLERDRRRAEDALRRSEALYRTTFEVAAVGIAHVDLNGRFLDANPRLTQILGRSVEELRTLRFQDITHPEDLRRGIALRDELVQGQRDSYTLDKRYLRPDGSVVWTVLTVGVMRDAAGAPQQFVSAIEDISERKRVEAALRDSEERLRKLTDNVEGAFHLMRLRVGGVLELVYASRGLARLFGLPSEPHPPSLDAVYARVHPDDLPVLLGEVERIHRSLEPLHLTYRAVLSDGLHWHETQAIAERESGDTVLLHGFTFDVTHRKNYEHAIVSAEAADRANRAKTEFLSRMSHELRTPLNAVLGFAQLLQLDAQSMSAQQRARVDHIERAGAHLLAMINDVLDLSRIEAGTMPLSPEPIEVAPLVDDALTLVASQALAAGVALTPAACAPELVVRADRLRLRQVLLNLLSNAIKYNRRGGLVQVRAVREGIEVAISVTDTGIGLSPEQLAHLWEPFNRLGAERTTVEGTGIGLALSQRMVQMMDGRLEVQSRLDQGSSFTVRLPAAETPAPLPPTVSAPVPLAEPGAATRSVIYAEDNPLNVELVRQVFQLRPHLRLRVARTGAEAVQLALEEPPDLLLLDMHLGDMTGLQVRDALAAEHIRPTCVALSADVLPARIARAKAAGFADYLAKPLDVAALMRCLDRLLGRPTSRFGDL